MGSQDNADITLTHALAGPSANLAITGAAGAGAVDGPGLLVPLDVRSDVPVSAMHGGSQWFDLKPRGT